MARTLQLSAPMVSHLRSGGTRWQYQLVVADEGETHFRTLRFDAQPSPGEVDRAVYDALAELGIGD